MLIHMYNILRHAHSIARAVEGMQSTLEARKAIV